MKLHEVIIENFRSIKQCTVFFGELTALVGENNAGKTAILRAINCFFNYGEEERFFQDQSHQHAPRTVTKIMLSFVDVPTRPQYENLVSSNNTLTIQFSYSYSQSGTHKPSLKCINDSKEQKCEMDIIQTIKEDIDFVYIPAGRSNKDLLWSENSIFAQMISAYLQDYTRNRDTLSKEVSRVSQRLQTQALANVEKDLSALNMLEHLGNYKIDYTESIGYSVFLNKLGLSIDENGKSRSITEYGSGIKSLSVISLHRLLAKIKHVSIILGIEEPETNLHPQAQKQLIAFIKNNRQDCETQAIFATHSPVIIDSLDHEDIVLVRRCKDTRRPFVSKVTQLQRDFWNRYSLKTEQLYKFFSIRNSEFFFAKYVVLVESSTDAQIFQHILKSQLGMDFYNISIIILDGIRNLKYPYCLLKELDIPFSVIADRDLLTDYSNGKKENSRNADGFFTYKNELSSINAILPILFPDEKDKNDINQALMGHYSRLFELMESKDIYVMKYCLEMDLIESSEIRNRLYELINIPEGKRSIETLLKENSNAIKEARNIIPAFMSVMPRDYPYSIKKIRHNLMRRINDCIKG